MYCSTCGGTLVKEARFCGECGSHVNKESVTQNEEAAISRQTSNQEYVEKTKLISKKFYQFALHSLKSPFKASQSVTEKDMVNGVISHVLLALLFPFFSYITAKALSGGFMTVPFGLMVVQPFFYFLIFMGIFAGVNFGVAKMLKIDLSYLSILTKWGSLNILPSSVILVSILFSLLSLHTLSAFLFAIGTGVFALSCFTLFFVMCKERKEEDGLDQFYGLAIVNAIMVIIYVLVGVSVMERVIQQINYGPLGMFF